LRKKAFGGLRVRRGHIKNERRKKRRKEDQERAAAASIKRFLNVGKEKGEFKEGWVRRLPNLIRSGRVVSEFMKVRGTTCRQAETGQRPRKRKIHIEIEPEPSLGEKRK